jgi:hypothetical protein
MWTHMELEHLNIRLWTQAAAYLRLARIIHKAA